MPSAHHLLAQWGLGPPYDLLGADSPDLRPVTLAEASPWLDVEGAFAPDCTVWLAPDLPPPALRPKLRRMGPPSPVGGLALCLLAAPERLDFTVGGNDNRIFIGRLGSHFFGTVNMWGDTRFAIGDGATCNHARCVLDASDIVIGRDAMLSDELLLQSADQHGIVDLTTRALIARPRPAIVLGAHVWLSRRAMLMPGADIGPGSIVAAGAIVADHIEAYAIAAGVPARIIRRNVTWSRDRHFIAPGELDFAAAPA